MIASDFQDYSLSGSACYFSGGFVGQAFQPDPYGPSLSKNVSLERLTYSLFTMLILNESVLRSVPASPGGGGPCSRATAPLLV